jgi:hypothetical protein
MRRVSLEIGQALPNSELSPGDHVRVDRRAFVHDVHVKVMLDLLGYDRGMWGGLEHFSSHVVDRYYQEVTGFPMFTVDFGGSIGKREVKVCDTIGDAAKTFGGSAQRSLDFGSPSQTELIMPSSAVVGDESSAQGRSRDSCPSTRSRARPDRNGLSGTSTTDLLQPDAPLLSDSDLDADWMASFEDFGNLTGSGTSTSTCLGCFVVSYAC